MYVVLTHTKETNADDQWMYKVIGENKYVRDEVRDDSDSPESMEDGHDNGELWKGNSSGLAAQPTSLK
jgi:hypothetical protein